jgi:hypothetical protein
MSSNSTVTSADLDAALQAQRDHRQASLWAWLEDQVSRRWTGSSDQALHTLLHDALIESAKQSPLNTGVKGLDA